jgi:hypothetical protein
MEMKLSDEFFTHVVEVPSYRNLLEECKINHTDEIPPPPVCIEIKSGDEKATFGTLGNFSALIGKAKSRKSFAMGLMISAATKNELLFDKIKGAFPPDKNQVLYFDTEQGHYHVQLSAKRIRTLIGDSNPENLHVFALRKYSPKERLTIINEAIQNYKNVGLVVIDGIKDLVTSINDEEQATLITSYLLKWSEENNIHIITVLHQNKGDTNARGHLGTEIVNKAETVLSITKSKEQDISIVEAEYCRGKEPESFAFEIDEMGLPRIVKDWINATNEKTIRKCDTLGIDELEQLITESFKHKSEMLYSELITQMKVNYKKVFHEMIGDNKVKEIKTICENYGIIKKKDLSRYYIINPDFGKLPV